MAFAILPLSWLIVEIFRRSRPKPNPHACRHCGYDLRATPDRCPECGNVPKDANVLPE
jgi:rubrerythrin